MKFWQRKRNRLSSFERITNPKEDSVCFSTFENTKMTLEDDDYLPEKVTRTIFSFAEDSTQLDICSKLVIGEIIENTVKGLVSHMKQVYPDSKEITVDIVVEELHDIFCYFERSATGNTAVLDLCLNYFEGIGIQFTDRCKSKREKYFGLTYLRVFLYSGVSSNKVVPNKTELMLIDYYVKESKKTVTTDETLLSEEEIINKAESLNSWYRTRLEAGELKSPERILEECEVMKEIARFALPLMKETEKWWVKHNEIIQVQRNELYQIRISLKITEILNKENVNFYMEVDTNKINIILHNKHSDDDSSIQIFYPLMQLMSEIELPCDLSISITKRGIEYMIDFKYKRAINRQGRDWDDKG